MATATPATTEGASKEPERPGVLSLLRDRSFRNYWIGGFFYFLVFGAQRFAFVLLVLELTDRAGLAGAVGFALGIPAFFITVPAGCGRTAWTAGGWSWSPTSPALPSSSSWRR